jgi:hypothetical protein
MASPIFSSLQQFSRVPKISKAQIYSATLSNKHTLLINLMQIGFFITELPIVRISIIHEILISGLLL